VNGARAYHHGDLRAAMLDVALATLEELGPQGLTMREVARRTGVSHAAPYRHFADRDQLIVAVVEQGFSLLEATMAEHRAAADDDPLSQFTAGGFAYFSFAFRYPAYYRVMFSGDLLSASGAESLQHTGTTAIRQIAADIEVCQRLGLLKPGDPMLQALALTSTMHGYVTLVIDNRVQYLLGEKYSKEQLIQFAMSSIIEGIGV
jgi:AcrR family transcriptional regulator|tara:strand:+ start:2054 stop:2665 length:612 start_codon:yes stop_codon:yes gene_type:complete